jgi:hypothetical protein
MVQLRNMKYAILSTDNNPDYYSLLPLTCHSWMEIGYKPIVLHVGEMPESVEMNTKGLFYKIPSVKGVKDSTVAQIARLFAPNFVQFEDYDVLITGDADMLVMKDIFTHHGEIVSYGYDLTGRSELPICYLKATVAKWKELMQSNGYLGLPDLPEKAYSQTWEDYWSVDQQLLTQRAKEYGFDKITFVDRGFAGPIAANRWDRYCWDKKPDDIIDVHMVRGPSRWTELTEMAKTLWPDRNWDWMADFKKEVYG